MKQSIFLITGWGGGEKLLNPLKHALQAQGHRVTLSNIFNAFDAAIFNEKVQIAMQHDVIVGWSLGGELAIVLADEIAKRTGIYKPLITLASNPCFVAHANWETAMTCTEFDAFKAAFEQSPVATLKRFGLLVTKGVNSAKSDFNFMQTLLRAQPISLLQHGLNLLEQYNLVNNLAHYQGHQLHLFAKYDALVPDQIVENMRKIDAKWITCKLLDNAAHSFPFTQVDKTCQEIIGFLNTSV